MCENTLSQRRAFITFKKIHLDEKPYLCGIWNKSFCKNSALGKS